MKLVDNRFFIWAVGLAMLALSPQSAYFWYDIKGIYLERGFDFHSVEVYAYSFAVWYVLLFKVASIWLNVTIVKKRRKENHAILWGFFAFLLPAFSLIIQGFLMGPDKKRNIRLIRYLLFSIAGCMVALFIAGIVASKIEQHNLKKFTQEYVQHGLRPSVVEAIEKATAGTDSAKRESYLQFENSKMLTINKDTAHIPFTAKFAVDAIYDKTGQIRIITEQPLGSFKDYRICYFDTTGQVIFRKSVFILQEFCLGNGVAEVVDEYFVNRVLVKRTYRLNTGVNETDFRQHPLYRTRFEFIDFKTVNEFKSKYQFPQTKQEVRG